MTTPRSALGTYVRISLVRIQVLPFDVTTGLPNTNIADASRGRFGSRGP
jgi:hypothetical protein